MGRREPSEANSSTHHHPALSLSLFIACIAATIAIITALCGGRSKNPPSSSPKASSPSASASASSLDSTESNKVPTSSLIQPPSQNSSEKPQDQEPSTSPMWKEDVFLSPAPHEPIITNTATTKRNLIASLSMKVPEALSKIRTVKEQQHKRQENASQDSIWMKTIILGDRCRVPSDEEDDATFYDEKGNRVPMYQPKTPRSLPVSRTNSYIDTSALPRQATMSRR